MWYKPQIPGTVCGLWPFALQMVLQADELLATAHRRSARAGFLQLRPMHSLPSFFRGRDQAQPEYVWKLSPYTLV